MPAVLRLPRSRSAGIGGRKKHGTSGAASMRLMSALGFGARLHETCGSKGLWRAVRGSRGGRHEVAYGFAA